MWRSQEMVSELRELHAKYGWIIVYPLVLIVLARSCSGTSDAGQDTKRIDAVRDHAQTAVTAYVSASGSSNEGAKAIYGSLVKPPAPQDGQPATAFPFPNETVLGTTGGTPTLLVTRTDKTQVWQVNVQVITDDGTEVWIQNVRVTPDDAVGVDNLPGRFPATKTIASPSDTSPEQQLMQVSSDSEIYKTVKDFFAAWLTGSGDLTRLADRSLPTFAKPPFDKIELTSVNSSNMPDKIDGNITVATTLNASNAITEKLHYNLTLTGASGRWVVTDVAAAPAAA